MRRWCRRLRGFCHSRPHPPPRGGVSDTGTEGQHSTLEENLVWLRIGTR